MKLFEKTADGKYYDAKGRDITELIDAYEKYRAKRIAGMIGGSAKSEAKTKAVRANGRKGGRPRKNGS